MSRKIIYVVIVFLISLFSSSRIYAQGMPPANVVVSEVRSGMLSPQTEFVGTVYYKELSDVASEVDGLIEAVNFEEGKRIRKGEMLVKLSSDLLEKTLHATIASYEQVLVEIESAKRDLERAEELHKEQLIADKTYDDFKYRFQGLEKKAASLEAEVERLRLELGKKTVTAPFNGVVIKRHVDRGEWLSTGSAVATIAKDDIVDIIVEVPQEILKYLQEGMTVPVLVGGVKLTGKIFAVVPSGSITARTFPVKIRLKNLSSLKEGMEARVNLPSAEKKKTLLIPRDALIRKSGISLIFIVAESHAKMIPVKVIGYSGLSVGIESEGLKEGMKVVTKGNERLMDGQPVNIVK